MKCQALFYEEKKEKKKKTYLSPICCMVNGPRECYRLSTNMFRLLIDKVTNFFKSYGMSCKLCCTNMNFTSFHHQ